MVEEVEIQCPFCGERIAIEVDASISAQKYIEDCSVCCRPIELAVACEAGAVSSVSVARS